MKSKFLWIGITAAVVILAAVSVLIAVSLSGNMSDTKSKTTTQVTQTDKTLSGKSLAEDRADVVKAATDLLNTVNAPMGAADYTALMKKIDAGDATIPQTVLDKIRIVDNLKTDKNVDKTLYQALTTFSSLAKQSTGSDTIAPLFQNATDGVTLDQELGIAYVPTTLFINSSSGVNGFSLEFVYVDGKWLLSPYMTLDELRLALVYSGGATSQTTK